MLIVFTSVARLEEAEALAAKIVEAKLAVCVQILPQMRSVYFWEGEIKTEPEHLLLIKTLDEKFAELEKFILAHHSYDVPEIAAIPADKVSDGYLAWMTEYLRS